MSTTIHFSLISNPQLLDVVDEEWMQDKLEDDGRDLMPLVSKSLVHTFLKSSSQHQHNCSRAWKAIASLQCWF